MFRWIKKLIIILLCFSFVFAVAGCSRDYVYVDITHIINPRTGMPYSVFYNEAIGRYENTTDHIISATVLSPSTMEGDCYTTAICVMGVEKAKEFIERKISENKIYSAILFTYDKKMLVFGNVHSYKNGSNFEGYKSYDLVYGALNDGTILSDKPFVDGKYTKYTEYAFSETIEFEMHLYGNDNNQKNRAKNDIMLFIERLDGEINITKQDSDLFRLNSSNSGERVEIGEYCYKLLCEAKRLYEETDGAFNVAITPLSRLWNVDIEGIGKYKSTGNKRNWTAPKNLPSLNSIEDMKALTDLSKLDLINEDGVFYAIKGIDGMEFDLGGIAKGYAVDMCAAGLEGYEIPSAQFNISGDIFEYGNYYNTDEKNISTWKIGITDPAPKHDLFKKIVFAMEVEGNSSIITSGDYERFYSYRYKI